MKNQKISTITEEALNTKAVLAFTNSVMCIVCDRIITPRPDNSCPICGSKEVYPSLPGHEIKADDVPAVRRVS